MEVYMLILDPNVPLYSGKLVWAWKISTPALNLSAKFMTDRMDTPILLL